MKVPVKQFVVNSTINAKLGNMDFGTTEHVEVNDQQDWDKVQEWIEDNVDSDIEDCYVVDGDSQDELLIVIWEDGEDWFDEDVNNCIGFIDL